MGKEAVTKKTQLNLALQGGGSHGAFTWGVLDRLLQESTLEIVGVSGTSAGGINGALLVYGLLAGGASKAREVLDKFWRTNSAISSLSPLQPTLFDKLFSSGNMDFNPIYHYLRQLTFLFTPEQLNPTNFNLLHNVLTSCIDFDIIQNREETKLFLSATNAKTSRIKVFSNKDITVDAVLASSCIPSMFKPVEIAGEYYWDGGYLGNPVLFPLFDHTDCNDVLIVQIDPTHYSDLPHTASEILDRATTMSFNSNLIREIRAVHFINKMVDTELYTHRKVKKINLHRIHTGDITSDLNSSSKANTSMQFLLYLHDSGYQMADEWILENYDQIGQKSTFNIEDVFY